MELPAELQRALQEDGRANDTLALEREMRMRRPRLMQLK